MRRAPCMRLLVVPRASYRRVEAGHARRRRRPSEARLPLRRQLLGGRAVQRLELRGARCRSTHVSAASGGGGDMYRVSVGGGHTGAAHVPVVEVLRLPPFGG